MEKKIDYGVLPMVIDQGNNNDRNNDSVFCIQVTNAIEFEDRYQLHLSDGKNIFKNVLIQKKKVVDAIEKNSILSVKKWMFVKAPKGAVMWIVKYELIGVHHSLVGSPSVVLDSDCKVLDIFK